MARSRPLVPRAYVATGTSLRRVARAACKRLDSYMLPLDTPLAHPKRNFDKLEEHKPRVTACKVHRLHKNVLTDCFAIKKWSLDLYHTMEFVGLGNFKFITPA